MYGKRTELWSLNSSRDGETESSVQEGEPRATFLTGYRKVTVCLPSCGETGESLTKQTSYFRDYGHYYDPELSMHVT